MSNFNKTSGYKSVDVVIDVSEDDDLSSAGNIGACTLTAIIVPASMDSTSLTFKGSIDGETFYDIYDDSDAQRSVTIDSSARMITVNPAHFAGIPFVKVQSGDTESGDRTITLIGVKAANE